MPFARNRELRRFRNVKTSCAALNGRLPEMPKLLEPALIRAADLVADKENAGLEE